MENLPQNDKEYFELDRMSNSALKQFRQSPRHYLWDKTHKSAPTPAMVFGSAFHCFILENARFNLEYAVKEKVDGRTKAGKEYNELFDSENYMKNIITSENYSQIQRMRDALFNDKLAEELISNLDEVEQPFLWNDELTGVAMKGKMDGTQKDYTIDLKTCLNAHPDTFGRTAFNEYLTQPAIYCDARGANKMNKGDFYFIAIEKDAPYGVSVLKCGNDFIQHGRAVYRSALEDYNFWLEMGSPDVGYEWRAPLGWHPLNVPSWVK